LAHPESKLTASKQAILKKLLKRRAGHEPLAYVRGHCEFYGRKFVLTPAVLQPRPESETLIKLFKGLVSRGLLKPGDGHNLHVADVGTGSGAIGITVALEVPNCQVELLEIDKNAAAVAKTNVDLFTLNISVIISDLLAGSSSNFDVLLCNLPYVPDDYQINLAALHEPRIAIYGGPDGLDIYRKLFDQIKARASQPLLILTESLPPQHEVLRRIARKAGYKQFQGEDFIQVFRSDIQHIK
jgi:release factor glutamine methyltransferase